MPRNGAGVYNLPTSTWYPAVNGVTATSADYNTQMADMQAALTQSVSQDGQTPMTGNLPMGNNKITGLAKGSALTDAPAMSQLGNYSGFSAYAVNTALTVANVGQVINIGATSLTMTLPLGSSVRIGDSFTFLTSVSFTIARSGSDTITGPTGGSLSSLVMYSSCTLAWTGSNWAVVMGGNPMVRANPGYIRTAEGLLDQWGSTVVTLSGGVTPSITFPVAFSTVYSIQVTNGDTTTTSIMPGVNTFNTAGFFALFPGGGATTVRLNWRAVGI